MERDCKLPFTIVMLNLGHSCMFRWTGGKQVALICSFVQSAIVSTRDSFILTNQVYAMQLKQFLYHTHNTLQ